MFGGGGDSILTVNGVHSLVPWVFCWGGRLLPPCPLVTTPLSNKAGEPEQGHVLAKYNTCIL